nr:meiotic recombination protein [Farysia itapuensis]
MKRCMPLVRRALAQHVGSTDAAALTRTNQVGHVRGFSHSTRLGKTRTTVAYAALTDRIMGHDGQPLAPLPSIPATLKNKGKARAKASTTPAEPESKSTASHPAPADGYEWPPLASSVLADISRFPDTILLTKVGGFYESYFHQAPILASILGIKLATRKWGGTTVPMAGFPVFQLEKYLKTLVLEKGLLVAIAEEFRAPSGNFKPMKGAKEDTTMNLHNETVDITRRVTRVVSPGTLIDEKFLDPFVNNFIVGVSALQPNDGQPEEGLRFGLAWLDVGTADFNTTVCNDYQSLRDEISRIAPREVVIDGSAITASDLANDVESTLVSEGYGQDIKIRLSVRDLVMDSSVYVSCFDPTLAAPTRSLISSPSTMKVEEADKAEDHAVKTLLAYLRTRLLDDSESLEALSITRPLHLRQESSLRIDAHTLDALEIKNRGREGAIRGSLFSVLRRTVTRGGTRLLQQWLTAPSTSLSTIEGRLDLVSLFLRSVALREDVRGLMRQGAGDAGRVLQKLVTKRNDEQDLLEIRDFIVTTSRITMKITNEIKHHAQQIAHSSLLSPEKNANEWEALQTLADKFHNLDNLGAQLGEAIDERVIESRIAKQESMAMEMETLALASNTTGGAAERRATAAYHSAPSLPSPKVKTSATEGQSEEGCLWGEPFEHLVRPASFKVLSNAVKSHAKLRREAASLQAEFQQVYGSQVSLRFVMGQGFVVHSRGKAIGSVAAPSAISTTDMTLHIAGKNRSTHTYYSKSWSLLGHKIDKTTEEIRKLEALELELLRQQVLTQIAALRHNARLVDQLDVLVGFSQVAEDYGLVRPLIDESHDLVIKDGRHLSVEIGLLEQGRLFTKNDVSMLSGDKSPSGGRVQLITGPNMGGKSTYLRQVAMICILAQCGCFVPATAARIGLVDAIFTRIGAQDDLFRDRSTFMVEMTEVGEILSRSTAKSLVIADEIGRGTSNLTGIAIGFSTLVELYNKRCRTLFATHFHEILDLVESSQAQGSLQDVDFFATDVFSSPETSGSSDDGSIVYSHKLRPGHNRDSYGLQVAQLANLPGSALDTAAKTLEYLQVKHPKGVDYRDSHHIIFSSQTQQQP